MANILEELKYRIVCFILKNYCCSNHINYHKWLASGTDYLQRKVLYKSKKNKKKYHTCEWKINLL